MTGELTEWAVRHAADAFETMPDRRAHFEGMVALAGTLTEIPGVDGDQLAAAAALHDIGLAPAFRDTGVTGLDGGTHLSSLGLPDTLVGLVANSCCGALEAELRGHGPRAATFPDEGPTPTRDALWFCCLRIDNNGAAVDAAERIAGFRRRYGADAVLDRYIDLAEPELLAAVERTEARLPNLETTPTTPG